jgi:cytoskeletal protein RodZ
MESATAMDAAQHEPRLEAVPDHGAPVELMRELAGALSRLEAGTLHLSTKAAADAAGLDTRVVSLAQVIERLARRVEMHDLALKDLAIATKPTRRPWVAVPMVLAAMVILGATTASKPLAALFEHSDVAVTAMPTLPPAGAPAMRAATMIGGSDGQPAIGEADAAKSAPAPQQQNAPVESAAALPASNDATPATHKTAPTARDAWVNSAVAQAAADDAVPAMQKTAPAVRDTLVPSSVDQASDLDPQSPVMVTTQAADFAATPVANGGRMVIRATADAWIQVHGKDNRALLSRVLHKDETWPVPDEAGLWMTTGNAGGTEILLDGAATPSLGGNGVVRVGVPLRADLLKAGIDTPSAVALLKTANTPAH